MDKKQIIKEKQILELDSIIGSNIEYFRNYRGFTQEQVAKAINKKRSFISKIETGFQAVKASDLKNISNHLSIPTDEFYIENIQEKYDNYEPNIDNAEKQNEERNPIPTFSSEKLSNIILFLIEISSTLKNQSAKHLQNLIFISDFDFYELYEEHLSSTVYIKYDYGVSGKYFFDVLKYLEENKYIHSLRFDDIQKYIVLKSANKNKIKLNEAKVIESVIDRFGKFSEKDLSEKIKNDVPYQGSSLKSLIDYEFAFYRDDPFKVRTYEDD